MNSFITDICFTAIIFFPLCIFQFFFRFFY